MTKVVYNACYGGFGLSDAAIERYAELKGITLYPEKGRWGGTIYYLEPRTENKKQNGLRPAFWESDLDRADPLLAQVVEELGDAANGDHGKLEIVELEPGERYVIDEYDGYERVMTMDDYNWRTA